jgi:hypothetical protein
LVGGCFAGSTADKYINVADLHNKFGRSRYVYLVIIIVMLQAGYDI